VEPLELREEPARQAVSPQVIFGGIVLVVVLLLLGVADFVTEWMWFDSLGYVSVFTTSLTARLALFFAGALIFLAIYAINMSLVRRFTYTYQAPPRRLAPASPWEELLTQLGGQIALRGEYSHWINVGIVVTGLFLAVLMGLLASGSWLQTLQAIHSMPFGLADPAFGRDISFYVFIMPVARALLGWLATALVLLALASAGLYALLFTYELAVNWAQINIWVPRAVKGHLLALAAVAFVLIAANHMLDLFDLVRSTRGAAYGASYTDLTAQRWAQYILALTALGAAGLCLLNIAAPGFRFVIIGVAVWGASLVLVGAIFPALVQNLDVKPNELDRELPYIAANIQHTRDAFGLADIEEREFPAEDAVAASTIQAEQSTIDNVRLWDHRPLLQTYNQVQAIRQYYQFRDVDVDRYMLEGQLRQVMVGARELDPERLPGEASRSWVARQLQYTHGYGVAMSLVNSISQEGLPALTIRDVPPVSPIPLQRPEIYFGEGTNHYVITRTTTAEFDFPRGNEGAFTTYEGEAGVPIGSLLNRMLFALKFQDPNFVLNNAFRDDSRLLFRRNVVERVQQIAPFLRLDPDPYVVVANGGLYWIQDTYTVTDRYPYSQPYNPGNRRRPFNYIRNSVKVVTNAYDGSMHFYVTDPADPLMQAYQRTFPVLFEPVGNAPAEIRSHFRYPEELFRIQADVYRLYHMTDPRVFYLREDVWAFPQELFYDQRQAMDPYYVIMRLPGEVNPEFIIMLPFVPGTRDNMIGWLTARSDEPNYGRMLVYKYPKDKVIFGPLQLETRIDQDPTISAQFSLWSQAGSRVIRGNLLVIPIGQSNLYVEPIYLQGVESPLPELKRVIVATGSRIVMEPSLEEGLSRLFTPGAASSTTIPGQPAPGAPTTTAPQPGVAPTPAAGPTTAPTPAAGPTPSAAPPAATTDSVAQLAASAQQRYNAAQEALRAGDFARYGEEIRALEAILTQLSAAAQAAR
jgi:uncharacterized membrane protein (UPF0182 family)